MAVKKTGDNGKFGKGDPRPPGAGRKPGTPNRTTSSLKAAIMEAFAESGGSKWLKNLAERDPRAFSSLLSRLIPEEDSRLPVFIDQDPDC